MERKSLLDQARVDQMPHGIACKGNIQSTISLRVPNVSLVTSFIKNLSEIMLVCSEPLKIVFFSVRDPHLNGKAGPAPACIQ